MPLKSGGAVENEFLRGRCNTGLMSVGKGLVCPTVGEEQFTNGGFDTGDFTGWVATGDWMVDTFGLGVGYVAGMSQDTVISGTLEQEFATPIPVACFGDTSVFKVYTYLGYLCVYEVLVWKIEIIYTDDTMTELDISGDPRSSWVEHDLIPILEAGKTIKGIRITGNIRSGVVGATCFVCVDGCTLTI